MPDIQPVTTAPSTSVPSTTTPTTTTTQQTSDAIEASANIATVKKQTAILTDGTENKRVIVKQKPRKVFFNNKVPAEAPSLPVAEAEIVNATDKPLTEIASEIVVAAGIAKPTDETQVDTTTTTTTTTSKG